MNVTFAGAFRVNVDILKFVLISLLNFLIVDYISWLEMYI